MNAAAEEEAEVDFWLYTSAGEEENALAAAEGASTAEDEVGAEDEEEITALLLSSFEEALHVPLFWLLWRWWCRR